MCKSCDAVRPGADRLSYPWVRYEFLLWLGAFRDVCGAALLLWAAAFALALEPQLSRASRVGLRVFQVLLVWIKIDFIRAVIRMRPWVVGGDSPFVFIPDVLVVIAGTASIILGLFLRPRPADRGAAIIGGPA